MTFTDSKVILFFCNVIFTVQFTRKFNRKVEL